MVLPHQLEVLKAIEPEVGAFIDDKMNLPAECWQPSDFLPDLSQEDFPETIKALQLRMANLPDTVLVSLIGNIITEEALPSYQTFFNLLEGINEERNVSSISPWVRWSRLWTAEENRHGDLLNKY
ncbi:MAG: acyl-ACP desaturase, partial [Cryomorphaceae bacterium]|nr:acyl-ACP desaturase [Cryomorphaceae bacterium]